MLEAAAIIVGALIVLMIVAAIIWAIAVRYMVKSMGESQRRRRSTYL